MRLNITIEGTLVMLGATISTLLMLDIDRIFISTRPCLQLDLECRVPKEDLTYLYHSLYIGSKALTGTGKNRFSNKQVLFFFTRCIHAEDQATGAF